MIFTFGTNVGYDLLYCVKENQPHAAYHSLYLSHFSFSPIKFSVTYERLSLQILCTSWDNVVEPPRCTLIGAKLPDWMSWNLQGREKKDDRHLFIPDSSNFCNILWWLMWILKHQIHAFTFRLIILHWMVAHWYLSITSWVNLLFVNAPVNAFTPTIICVMHKNIKLIFFRNLSHVI